MVDKVTEAAVVGGVDTHKDLHVAAVVDQNNKVLGTQYFSTTRQGYRQMLAWMTSFGTLKLSAQVPMVPVCFVIFRTPG
jgi:1-acyl-sn-glycerol-3-phosphate acyltransferase